MTGILTKTGVKPTAVDYVLMGTVIQEVKNQNIARDAGLAAGIPHGVPSHTVTQACISSNQAICSGINLIQTGQADVVVAGGVETMSDVPIKFSKPLRERMLASRKVKGMAGMGKLLKGLKLKDLAPETPSIANFTTGEVMGHSCDRLADHFGVSRADSDAFALRSHVNAAKAHADGLYDDEVLAYEGSTAEGGVRGDSTIEKVGWPGPDPHPTRRRDHREGVGREPRPKHCAVALALTPTLALAPLTLPLHPADELASRGLRQALRHGDGSQRVVPDRRRVGHADHVGGEGARARLHPEGLPARLDLHRGRPVRRDAARARL